MSDIDFAENPPEQLDDGPPLGFAQHGEDEGKEGQQAGLAGMMAAKQPSAKQDQGAGPHEGLLAMATLVGMARQGMPGLDPVDSPTGLMSLLRSPLHNEPQSSDVHRYNLDLSRNSVAGGNLAGTKSALGNAGGGVRDMAQTDSMSSAMAAVGNLSNSLGSGLGNQLAEAGKRAQGHMTWLGQGVKDIYKIRRQ
ncbi:MAG: hypothetical protein JNJ46_02980 [Myxococcales bacterium]|nr:hypothetical protein [Myxococcales bacterium]